MGLVQPLGARSNVYLSTPNHDTVIAQIPADTHLRVGDAVGLHVDMNHALFFAPGEAGRVLASNRDRWSSGGNGNVPV